LLGVGGACGARPHTGATPSSPGPRHPGSSFALSLYLRIPPVGGHGVSGGLSLEDQPKQNAKPETHVEPDCDSRCHKQPHPGPTALVPGVDTGTKCSETATNAPPTRPIHASRHAPKRPRARPRIGDAVRIIKRSRLATHRVYGRSPTCRKVAPGANRMRDRVNSRAPGRGAERRGPGR
jgi:hypothetical protein